MPKPEPCGKGVEGKAQAVPFDLFLGGDVARGRGGLRGGGPAEAMGTRRPAGPKLNPRERWFGPCARPSGALNVSDRRGRPTGIVMRDLCDLCGLRDLCCARAAADRRCICRDPLPTRHTRRRGLGCLGA